MYGMKLPKFRLRQILSLAFLLFLSVQAQAQKIDNMASFRSINSNQYFRFSYDNDFFTAKDQNYTQGYSFEFVSPLFKKNPINKIFVPLKGENLVQRYGLSLEHIGFTPGDIRSSEIQLNDRPFASAIMLKSFRMTANPTKKWRVSTAFNMGILGPIAFGEAMQVGIHQATGNIIPQGWPNQIQNQLVLNYELHHEKQLWQYKNRFALQSNTSVRFGSLFTDASLGATVRIGLLNNPFEEVDQRKFQLYFYGQSLVTAIGHDATLQGKIIGKKTSPYIIPANEINRVRAQQNMGIVMKIGSMYFEYSQAIQSKEFDTASFYRWGGVKLGFVF
jgi:hypothetical protein